MNATIKQLQNRCKFWQGILRLQDWDVVVELVDYDDLEGRDVLASITCYGQHRRALIKFLKHEQRGKETAWPSSDDETLVHELLHIFSDPLHPLQSEHQQLAEEVMIETLARLIVRLYEEGRQ